MKNENYITIQGWMVNDLKLKPIDLLVYAVIYGFSQDGQSKFTGALSYLEGATGASKSTVKRSLKSLVEAKHIAFEEVEFNGNTYKQYFHTGCRELSVCPICSEASHICECDMGEVKMNPPVSIRTEGEVKMNHGGSKMNGGEVKMNPNNTINTKDNNTINSSLMSKIEILDLPEEKRENFTIAESFRILFIKNLEEKNLPTTHQDNAKFKDYADQIRLMRERDGATLEHFRRAFRNLQSPEGAFWKQNCLSIKTLRKQFQKILLIDEKHQVKSASAAEKTRDSVTRFFEQSADGSPQGQ